MGPFVQVVLGQIISLFGNAALRFVLPLILLRQTGSAAVYGAATALALLPALAGTLAGGVLADRCRKARLMVVLDLAAAGLALGAAASADNLPTVLWAPAALCALYALQGLYQPVVRASLPLLRTGDRLVQGNAVIQLVDTLDELLGPLLGSVLLGVMGLRPLLVLCGACFAASALLEWQIRIPGDRPQPRTQGKPDFAADLRESLTYLYHSRPELLRLAGIMALVNLVEIPAVVVGIPVVIVQYLGQSDAVLGAVQAVLSVGGLAGGALAGRSRHPLSDRQALGLLLGTAISSSRSDALLTPLEEPALDGLINTGYANRFSMRATTSSIFSSSLRMTSSYAAWRTPVWSTICFVYTLSIETLDASTPHPTYGIFASSKMP